MVHNVPFDESPYPGKEDQMGKLALYSAVGEEITHFDVDVEAATLTRRGSIAVPANVQYAWTHPSRRQLYVASSDRGSAHDKKPAASNHLTALRIDPVTGALSQQGPDVALPHRAVHICVDGAGRFVLSAHNVPQPGITVHRIESDGSLGERVQQPNALEYGIYPHQVRVMPSDGAAILVDRGNDAEHGKAEDPGALRIYRMSDEGVFSDPDVIAPNGGYGFGPRHMDFHPTLPWAYVSLERQSQLNVYRCTERGMAHEAAYTRDLLADRANVKPRQLAGAIHVHPNGRCVYVINRNNGTVDFRGRPVFNGGENHVVVFAIDPTTGEPTLLQHADTHSYHVRTFAIDPSGRLLVTASITPLAVRRGDDVEIVPAALSVFRIGEDGRLTFVRKYDVPTEGKVHYWMNIVEVG
jgi:6-phosphogluconolactonase (cycloisomerase 2 family)